MKKIGGGDTYQVEGVLPIEFAEVGYENLVKEMAWYVVQRWCVIEVHWILYRSHTTRYRILTHAMPPEGGDVLGLTAV